MILLANLAFRGWFPWWLALLLALGGAVILLTIYLAESKRTPLPVKLGLGVVRVLIALTVLLLILRPVWQSDRVVETRRPVAVLLDNSRSMTLADSRFNQIDRWRVAIAFDAVEAGPMPDSTSSDLFDSLPVKPSRIDILKAVLGNKRLNLLENLADRGPLQISLFGTRRQVLESSSAQGNSPPDWLKQLKVDQPQTALYDAAFELINKDANELPAAIVIMTDGRDNSSTRSLQELALECKNREVPLHIYGVGSTNFAQLQLRQLPVRKKIYAGDTVEIPVLYRAEGMPAARLEFTATLDGRPIASKTITLKEQGAALRETLSFVPSKKDAEKPGKQKLEVTVTWRTPDEIVTRKISQLVQVVDSKLKILMVDSAPRWDFKFIQRGLRRDARIEADFILTEGDPRALKSGPPFLDRFPEDRQQLKDYHILILGDVDAQYFTKQQLDTIRAFVAEGKGLLQLAGPGYGPRTYLNTPLADVLPVEFAADEFPIDDTKIPAEFQPRLTRLAERTITYALDDDSNKNKEIWKQLPGMYWYYPVQKLKPGAEVFLEHPSATMPDKKPMPLVASHYYGNGYVTLIGFDETWRWRYNEDDKYFGRFWSQMIYSVGARTGGTQLSLDVLEPVLGQTGNVYARLFTNDMKPLITERIEARLEQLDAESSVAERSRPIDLIALPGQTGEYIATIPFNKTGRYQIKVINGSEEATYDYTVNLPDNHELTPGGLAEEELQALANATSGKLYHEEELHELPNSIVPQKTRVQRKEEILLWNRWMLFLLIGLLSLEWFVRKFNSLS